MKIHYVGGIKCFAKSSISNALASTDSWTVSYHDLVTVMSSLDIKSNVTSEMEIVQ